MEDIFIFETMLSHAEITKTAQFACTAHALTTQTEEVMGLLIGVWAKNIVQISHVHIVKRQNNTRQKDRVEIAPEDVSKAAIRAEELAKETGKDLKVVGLTVIKLHLKSDFRLVLFSAFL